MSESMSTSSEFTLNLKNGNSKMVFQVEFPHWLNRKKLLESCSQQNGTLGIKY